MVKPQSFKRYILTFTKTSDTMRAYDLARQFFSDVVVAPVPNQISEGCGLSVVVKDISEEKLREFFSSLTFASKAFAAEMCSDENAVNRITNVSLLTSNEYINFSET